MAFFNSRRKPVRPEDLQKTLEAMYLTPQQESNGIASRPRDTDDSMLVAAGFFNDMFKKREEKAAQARAELMERYARESADDAAKLREIMEITRSKASKQDMIGSEEFDAIVPAPESEPIIEADTLKPEQTSKEGLMSIDTSSATKTMKETIEDVLETVIDSDADGVQPSTGKGLMSPRLDGKDGDLSVPTQYGTAVFEMSTDLKETEGVDPHIGADWENVTLALGIVPTSGLKIDGMVVPSDRAKRGKWLKKNGYVNSQGKPTEKFSSANIDTSGAVKDGIKRSDYSSDTAWSAAVIDNFKKGAEERVEGFNDLGVKEQKSIIDLAWNMGVGGLEYSGNKAFIGELKKAPNDRDVSVMLEAGKHVTVDGKVMRGLARRKALFVNDNIENPDLKIVKIKQTSKGNKTYHTYINALGQSVKTIELGKRHSGSSDGIIDVATGEEVEATSPRPMLRPEEDE